MARIRVRRLAALIKNARKKGLYLSLFLRSLLLLIVLYFIKLIIYSNNTGIPDWIQALQASGTVPTRNRLWTNKLARLKKRIDPEPITTRDAMFQPVQGEDMYVYSAFLERRTPYPAIRIIAVGKDDKVYFEHVENEFMCHLWMKGKKHGFKAKVTVMREDHHGHQHGGLVIVCELPRDVNAKEAVGASVGVSKTIYFRRPPTNRLTVMDTDPKKGIRMWQRVQVCVPPVHSFYDQVDWLLEWIEMNRLLGVSHFSFYDYSMSNNTYCLLKHYRDKGVVSIYTWNLPYSTNTVWMLAQDAMLNDCVYRSMSSSGWLLPLDLDEVLIPRQGRTYHKLLSALDNDFRANSNTPAAYIFRHVFFYLFWEDDAEAPEPLVTAKKTRRLEIPHGAQNRTKYLVRPQDAVEIGVHYVFEFMYDQSALDVPTNRGLLHHYRAQCPPKDVEECETEPSVVDRIAHEYSADLMSRMKEHKSALQNECRL